MITAPKKNEIVISSKPRVAFLGVGWIGLNRMKALALSEYVDVTAVADPDASRRREASECVPGAPLLLDLDEILAERPEAVVIATPNALHADQTIQALEAKCAVFCQKPLSRTAKETQEVVGAARRADRLLGVDLSYRHLSATAAIRNALQSGEIGEIYAVQGMFHNAYGPDKTWFYDSGQSGGGCVLDLGVHLIDLVLYLLDFPNVTEVHSRLYHHGKRLRSPSRDVEDYASIQME
ncbi:MAG: gfo/Idh/MocA family oxidoreductase, partial [Chitinivibrionales bacterium]|nr:gfo/Idh/MocA family oxidoreductase [Chitinivibrionales bacterium]MBD3356672.1 gfo/Idh/MocA family oxidoreductase [Chitinivibrionales bacterium]